MKQTQANKTKNSVVVLKKAILVIILVAMLPLGLLAQADSTKTDTTRIAKPRYLWDRYGDPFSLRPPSSPLIMGLPKSITTGIHLDSSGRFFRITETLGDSIDYRPPSQIFYDSYRDLRYRQMARGYWKGAVSPEDTTALNASSKNVIPPIPLGSAFHRLFGGDQITIKPNGSVTLDFGMLWQRVDNPQLTVRQQRTGGFNFDQQIRMNLVGKVGEKMNVNFNFDTKNTFQFEQAYNIGYTAFEEDIVHEVQMGNVSFPVSNSLITGAQNLFGVKTKLRFGRLWINAVASNQRGTTETIRIKNGGQGKAFEIRADSYEENRHFFLAHFFRDNYERALRNLPVVNSGVVVTRVEVYVTNRNNNTQSTRNIVAVLDLGENFNSSQANPLPADNDPAKTAGNNRFQLITGDPNLRKAELVSNLLQQAPYNYQRGGDFDVITTSRKLEGNEFTLNTQLGYISLNTPLRNDEVLAVSFEYTYNGVRYKVGEMMEDYQGLPDESVILLKMLRPSTIRTDLPRVWDLMMKNIYSLQTNQLQAQNFKCAVIYKDDNTGLDQPTLQEGVRAQGQQLAALMRADQLNMNRDRQPDGNVDFIEGITIDAQNGRVIFPTLEPFGATMRSYFDANSEALLVDKYVFNELYRETQITAKLNRLQNKYFLKGSYQAGGGSEIVLPGINIAQGSVVVRAGSTLLTEGSDYTVDYQFGRVRILNQAVLTSSKEIVIQYERADLFSMNTRSLMGVDLEYQLNKQTKFTGTLMHFNERPLISRIAIGNEPVSNTVFGAGMDYRGKSLMLTRLVDKLPGISTKQESSVALKTEVAGLIPGAPRLVGKGGVAYIDDFEGAEVPYDLGRSVQTWALGSVPKLIKDRQQLVLNGTEQDLKYNHRRARLAWYNIDNVFYTPNTGLNVRSRPANITNDDMLEQYVRLVPFNEVFPKKQGSQINAPEVTFDLAFYPDERGPYNYNSNATDWGNNARLLRPEESFASITKAIAHDINFENINIQYVEFWLMDPFISEANRGKVRDKANTTGGELYINLGNISEDVIPDSRHFFENGLTPDGRNTASTVWGKVPTSQFLTNAFGTEDGVREVQDVGFDGLKDEDETPFLQQLPGSVRNQFTTDPAGDDFLYYLDPAFDQRDAKVLERYKFFNGTEGNSPENSGDQSNFVQSSSINPDNEDLNRDNTLTDLEQYWQYKIDLRPGLRVGDQYIVDKVETRSPAGDPVTWYQFRVPLRSETAENVNGINGFQSIRFIRMFMTGWKEPVVLRMAQFQFVGAQWRPSARSLQAPGPALVVEPPKSFVVSSVNVEENSDGGTNLVPYDLPPGFNRDFDRTSTVTRQLNEQSLQVCVEELEDSDGRGVFKNLIVDAVNYQYLKMEVHAHTPKERTLDGDLSAFIRLGTDESENYYEIEWPLLMTPLGATIREDIWPADNKLEIAFEDLIRIKAEKNRGRGTLQGDTDGQIQFGKYKIFIKGNPDISNVQTVMVGVRNPKSIDGRAHDACIWFNELRVTDIKNRAGYAANVILSTQLADVASINGSVKYSTIGYGGIQDRVGDRARYEGLSYDISTQINLDKFFLGKVGIVLPLFMSIERDIRTPQFDPLNPDTELDLSVTRFINDEERILRRSLMQTISERRSINLMNVRKQKMDQEAKSHLWDIENISLSAAYADEFMRDQFTDSYMRKQWSLGANYSFASKAEPWAPFSGQKNSHPYAKWFKDFNLSPMPTSINFGGRIDRQFARTQLRNGDFTTDGLDPYFQKAFTFTRNYAVQWNLTKSLNLDYGANAFAIIDEPFGEINTAVAQDSIWTNLRKLGRMKTFSQQVSATYKLPFDKFPVTDWLNADARYNADYSWQAGPQGLVDDSDNPVDVGNIIQNTQQKTLNGKIDLEKLYNKVPFLKKINTLNKGRKPTAADDPLQIRKKKLQDKIKIVEERMNRVRDRALPKQEKEEKQPADEGGPGGLRIAPEPGQPAPPPAKLPDPEEGTPAAKKLAKLKAQRQAFEDELKLLQEEIKKQQQQKKEESKDSKFGRGLLGVIMSMKDINVSYSQSNSTILPGFTPVPKYVGMDNTWAAPGFSFLLGSQDPSILNNAQFNGWLAPTDLQNTPFLQNKQEQLSFRTSMEPINEFKVQIDATRSKNGSYSEVRRWVPDSNAFETQSPLRNGGYTISYFSMKTSFKGLRGDNTSPLFEQFQANLPIIKSRLDPLLGAGAQGESFDSTSQDVMIPAFIAAYTGIDARQVNISPFRKGIPIPNWKVTYNGLGKIPALKEKFKSISITHGYKSEFSTGSYTSSLFYVDQGLDVSFNFDENIIPFGAYRIDPVSGGALIPVLVFNDVSISEQFNPLIGINMRTNNNLTIKADYKKRRDMGLNLSNAQVTEMHNNDITLDLGYSKTKMKVPFGKKVLENEVTFRVAFTLRSTKTVQHKLNEGSIATNGNLNMQFKPTVNYQINKRTSFQAYFERSINDPVVSNSPKRTTTAFGARLTFNLAE